MLMRFCSLALSVSAVHSTDSPPELEQQFSTNASAQMYTNGKLVPADSDYFEWYMDQPNDRYRTEKVDKDGKNNTQIYDLAQNKAYYLITDTYGTGKIELCHNLSLAIPPGSKQPPLIVDLHNVSDLGPTTFGGQPAELWEAHIPKSINVPQPITADYFLQAHAAPGRNPMLLKQNDTYKNSAGDIVSMVRDYTKGLKVGPPPAWMFSLPPGLACTGAQ
jgi:hypothetical protein